MGKTPITLFALPLLLLQSVTANDCSIGTHGGNVFIEDDHDIAMAREEIHIRMFRDSAVVACKFWFYNRAKAKTRTVGFPDYWASPPSASTPIQDFRTWVDGKGIQVDKKIQSIIRVSEGDTLPDEDREWFVWEKDFRERDTTVVENHYTAAYSRCNCEREMTIHYVIGTGRPWNGMIGKGTVVFDLEGLISTAWMKRPSLPSPNMKVTTEEGRIRVEFGKYEPGPEDRISLSFFPPWAPACSGVVDREFVKLLSGKSRQQLREMRNEVFARHGYVFEDKELAALFSGKPWYKPDAGFKMEMVSKEERETIAGIKRIEDRK